MIRLPLLLASVLLVAAPPVRAQQENLPVVYVAYYKVGYDDLGEWTELHHRRDVRVLRDLQERGVIEGWSVYQHSTAGEYNWRFAVRAPNWESLGRFWSEYLQRLRDDPEAFEHVGSLIQAHYDEIWNTSSVEFAEPLTAPARYLYDSRFQIGFDDLEEWNRAWSERAAPVLRRAMEDGLLAGWVTQAHNTGDRYNWKVLYFFQSWDSMDDVFDRLLGELTGDPAFWDRMAGMIQAHDDVIWEGVTEPEGM